MQMNVTAAFVRRVGNEIVVIRTEEQPQFLQKNGKPVIGNFVRRLMTVREVAGIAGVSLSRAKILRKQEPAKFLADFPGQPTLAELALAA